MYFCVITLITRWMGAKQSPKYKSCNWHGPQTLKTCLQFVYCILQGLNHECSNKRSWHRFPTGIRSFKNPGSLIARPWKWMVGELLEADSFLLSFRNSSGASFGGLCFGSCCVSSPEWYVEVLIKGLGEHFPPNQQMLWVWTKHVCKTDETQFFSVHQTPGGYLWWIFLHHPERKRNSTYLETHHYAGPIWLR